MILIDAARLRTIQIFYLDIDDSFAHNDYRR